MNNLNANKPMGDPEEFEMESDLTDEEVNQWLNDLPTKQQLFVAEYCVDFNATQAAIRAGYTDNVNSAGVLGYRLLKKAKISSAVKQRLTDLIMSAEEAAKLTGDAARSRLNDYMVVKLAEKSTTIKKSLAEVIAERRADMAREDKYAERVGMEGEELDGHQKQQQKREREIIRLEIELEENPEAFREVAGPAEMVEVAELDLVALARAKEGGRIKTLSFGEYGPKVELSADNPAASKILEYHGRLIKKHEHSGPGGGPLQVSDATKLTDEQLREQIAARRDRLAALTRGAGSEGTGEE